MESTRWKKWVVDLLHFMIVLERWDESAVAGGFPPLSVGNKIAQTFCIWQSRKSNLQISVLFKINENQISCEISTSMEKQKAFQARWCDHILNQKTRERYVREKSHLTFLQRQSEERKWDDLLQVIWLPQVVNMSKHTQAHEEAEGG